MDKTVPPGRVKGTLTPPCSKSYAQRALAAALLSEEVSVLRNIEFCDDTRSALQCIETLGARVRRVGPTSLSIRRRTVPEGLRAQRRRIGPLDTSFHARGIALRHTRHHRGRGSLLRRPMQMMFEPLRRLGVRGPRQRGIPPHRRSAARSRAERPKSTGRSRRQFITGLLLALPLARRDTSLHVRGAVSTPYLDMTLDTAARFGIEISQRDYEEFYIPGRQRYRSTYFSIEGDWSAAAMLLVAGATAGEVTVRNVSMLSKQADTAICTALVRAGAAVINEEDSVTALHRPLRAFEFDATNCPDLFPALAALAAAADGVSVIRGTSRLEYKECNRSEAIREEYAKLGIEVDTSEEDLMKITRRKGPRQRTLSHGDHRMAMSLAVAALRSDEAVEIEGAESVAKSYPGFFEDLEHIRV
ncbi:MAG: 3-phosphoshikimate 1-carboxyvinyltransferase [Alistipes shahii]